ncbi:GNAT family N-acetyltransferase [Pseudobutyrivibrio sp.]|uniref:GNAT family N-acetyltransferase n=1 Tax=Pseudobutyrivibrio sp. TaxID=2014367 RepID=UPI0025F511ED|nr:GNAT family N-acetyltransferase [Pseudobutyrivibrio sp.]
MKAPGAKPEKRMKLQRLDENQITKLYQEHMVVDFPKDELKPLNMILKSVQEGFYDCFGLFENEKIVGYTFMVKQENSYLIDYIAIFPEHRNKGVGANLLTLIDDYLGDADRIIGEVEDPAYTDDEEQKTLQTRRLGFYLRNNCYDTGLRVECFGVKFIILEAGKKRCRDKDEVWDLYSLFYKKFLSEERFEKNIWRISDTV